MYQFSKLTCVVHNLISICIQHTFLTGVFFPTTLIQLTHQTHWSSRSPPLQLSELVHQSCWSNVNVKWQEILFKLRIGVADIHCLTLDISPSQRHDHDCRRWASPVNQEIQYLGLSSFVGSRRGRVKLLPSTWDVESSPWHRTWSFCRSVLALSSFIRPKTP